MRGIKKPRAVELRTPIEHLELSVRQLAHPLLEDIRALQTALRASINEVVTLIKDGPVMEHRFVGCHGCEDAGKIRSEGSAANGFKFDGSTFSSDHLLRYQPDVWRSKAVILYRDGTSGFILRFYQQ